MRQFFDTVYNMKDVLFSVQRIDPSTVGVQMKQAQLYPERKRRIAAMKRKEAIAASLLGDWIARKLASELTCLEMDMLTVIEGEHKKPLLSGAEAEISIAHSGDYAAAAAAKRPVGIDLERVRPLPNTVLLRMCSPAELHWVNAHPEKSLYRFFRLWTMKEAFGKMLGIGIFSSRQFYARFVEDTLIELYPDCLFLFPEAPEGYMLSICVQRSKA